MKPIAFAWMACAAASAFAQQDSPAPRVETTAFPARLSDVEGSVRIAPAPGGRAQPDAVPQAAAVNTPVLAGTEITTGDDGRAEIEFNDGNIARITPNSSVELVALPVGGEEVRALRGLTYFESPDGTPGVLTVDAGPDAVKVDPGSLLRFDMDQAPIKIAALKGAGHLGSAGGGAEFDVQTRQTATVDPRDASGYDVNDGLADVSWDQWNADRDMTLSELAESQTEVRVENGDANSPAWNDLDYYGTWYDVPGQGQAWAPDGVDQNFDPYGAGSWGYYPGVGYTWISAYPWGWLPYHAGTWNYFAGFGWGWLPNGGGYNGVGWYPYTGVHLGPARFRVPLPLDARLRTRLTGAPQPTPTPLRGRAPIAVNRAPQYGFRGLGGARPEPRQFPLAGAGPGASAGAGEGAQQAFASPVPVVQPGRAQYPGGIVRTPTASGFGSGLGVNPIRPGYAPSPGRITPPPGVIPSTPRALPGPVHPITAPPRVIAPAPVRIAPPPTVAAPPAVHAAPAGPRGH